MHALGLLGKGLDVLERGHRLVDLVPFSGNIDPCGVASRISVNDAVRIHHWDDFEVEVFSKTGGLQQEVDNSLHDEGAHDLGGVLPPQEDDEGLLGSSHGEHRAIVVANGEDLYTHEAY